MENSQGGSSAKKNKRYLTEITINGNKVIPSDTFTIGGNKYILMDIWEDFGSGVIDLEIMGMEGENSGKTAMIPLLEFENVSMENFGEVFKKNAWI